MPEASLGLIMILRNEASNLPRSLTPVAHCFDEVVVADTGSADDTINICKQLGAKVCEFAWRDDFAAARNFSIEKASADWLFWLDGDNAITPEMANKLRAQLPEAPAVLWALEQLEPSGGQLWQKRCFPRRPEAYFTGKVHEQLVHPPDWPSIATQVTVRHWGYADHGHAQEKGRYYQTLLNQMLEQDPSDYYARFQLARTLMNFRDFEQAIKHFSTVISSTQAQRENPQIWAYAHFLLAQAYERLARPLDAVKILDQLLHIKPQNGLAHYHRGHLAYVFGDYDNAAKHLTQALALGLEKPFIDMDPGKTLFLAEYYLGRSFEGLGRMPEAEAAMERAANRQPGNPTPRTDLARLLLAQGRSNLAKDKLKQTLDIWPDNRMARKLLNQAESMA